MRTNAIYAVQGMFSRGYFAFDRKCLPGIFECAILTIKPGIQSSKHGFIIEKYLYTNAFWTD